MIFRVSSVLLLCLVGSCLFLFTSSVVGPVSGNNWQRVSQSVIAVLCLLTLVFLSKKPSRFFSINRSAETLCGLILVLGIFSAYRAHQYELALVELAVLLACCCIASTVARGRKSQGVIFDRLVFSFIMVLCGVKILQFACATAAAFTVGLSTLDTSLLLEGFSNRRFYGQFQTFTLPIIALPLLLATPRHSTKAWVFAMLACWWMIAICGGTRGTWLGMGCAAAVTFFCGSFGRRWFCWQLAATAVGLLMFWGLFSLLPHYLGIEMLNYAGDRLTTSLSARDVIWHQAWEMIKERPLLGFGPMHFADIHNPVAAHPHQAILQWACEWGVPSTLLVGWLAARGLFATLILIRKKAASSEPVDVLRICLFASLLGALAQSMVDGVIVMPYSQLWLAIVVGWLMGIHEWSVMSEPSGPALRWGWLAIMVLAVGFLVYVVVRDFPHLDEREQQYAHDFGGNLQPRFWLQGFIGVKSE